MIKRDKKKIISCQPIETDDSSYKFRANSIKDKLLKITKQNLKKKTLAEERKKKSSKLRWTTKPGPALKLATCVILDPSLIKKKLQKQKI